MRHFTDYQDYRRHWVFQAIRAAAMRKANHRCVECGERATEVHHTQYPKPWGTFDTPANLKPLCHACHCQIHGKTA
jgi:5-methylcytosine-specific restriction endonuclease McrA